MSGAAAPVTFGPGSLESIHLERRRRRPGTDAERLEARVTGTFKIYCGAGNEHTQPIRSEWLVVEWVPGKGGTKGDTLNDFTDADALAHELVNWALEGWSDPCEDGTCGSCGAITDRDLRVDGEPFHEPDADCRSVVSA